MGAQFDGKKIVVVGGSAGMGRQAALDVIDRGGSAVIIGRSKSRVDDTVAELTNRRGQAWGIAAELTDRSAVTDIQGALSEHHSDATLMVNAAGFFIPKPFLDYDAQFYDAYQDLNYALFFLTQTVVAGMNTNGAGGSIVNIGSMWAHQAIGLTPSSGYSMQKSRPARADPQSGHRTGLPSDPRQRRRTGGGENTSLRRVHPQGRDRRHAGDVRATSSPGPRRHPHRRGQRHHLSALRTSKLDHRHDSQR
jgi:hypothetical protein